MSRLVSNIKRIYSHELPIIRLYGILYLAGVFIGALAAVLLRDRFSAQAQLLFSPENCSGFIAALLQQIICFLLIFFLGLTVVGVPFLPLYPIYKGFSIGLLIALATILHGIRGLIFGTFSFFLQNFLYAVLGYFLCYSSARLSISFLELLKGRGKHGAIYREFLQHIYCLLILIPFLSLGALWEWKIVPFILNFL